MRSCTKRPQSPYLKTEPSSAAGWGSIGRHNESRRGIGCKAVVRCGEQTMTQQLIAGSSYASSHQPRLFVGLGPETAEAATTARSTSPGPRKSCRTSTTSASARPSTSPSRPTEVRPPKRDASAGAGGGRNKRDVPGCRRHLGFAEPVRGPWTRPACTTVPASAAPTSRPLHRLHAINEGGINGTGPRGPKAPRLRRGRFAARGPVPLARSRSRLQPQPHGRCTASMRSMIACSR